MDESTTTTSPDQAGVQDGVAIDDQGMAIPDQSSDTSTQPSEDGETETAGTQTETSQDTSETTEDAPTTEDKSSDEIIEWATNKGLEINPDNANEVKLARMQREAEQAAHAKFAEAKALRDEVKSKTEYSDDAFDELRAEVRTLKAQNSIGNFYKEYPDASEYDAAMADLVREDPNMLELAMAGNLKPLYALAKLNKLDSAKEELRQDGGREALKTLAQKQQATAITGNAVTSTLSSDKITPQNVDRLVAQNDQEWFKKNYDAINKAMAG